MKSFQRDYRNGVDNLNQFHRKKRVGYLLENTNLNSVRAEDGLVNAPCATTTVRVRGLVRPFKVNELKEKLESFGGPIEDFFLNDVMSVCYAAFRSKNDASNVVDSLNGARWPDVPGTNPLIVDYLYELEAFPNRSTPKEAAQNFNQNQTNSNSPLEPPTKPKSSTLYSNHLSEDRRKNHNYENEQTDATYKSDFTASTLSRNGYNGSHDTPPYRSPSPKYKHQYSRQTSSSVTSSRRASDKPSQPRTERLNSTFQRCEDLHTGNNSLLKSPPRPARSRSRSPLESEKSINRNYNYPPRNEFSRHRPSRRRDSRSPSPSSNYRHRSPKRTEYNRKAYFYSGRDMYRNTRFDGNAANNSDSFSGRGRR